MFNRRQNEQGFTPLILVVLVLVVLVAGFAGWRIVSSLNQPRMSHSNKRDKKPVQNVDFENCKRAAGSVVQESYPETCVTKDGRSFVNKEQQVSLSGQVIDVQEWRIKLTMPSDIKDASYVLENEYTVRLTTATLRSLRDQITDCKSGMQDVVIERARPGEVRDGQTKTQDQLAGSGVKFGEYYYYKKPMIEPACISTESPKAEQALAIAGRLNDDLRTATTYQR